MKRIILSIIVLFAVAGAAFAQTSIDGLVSKDAKTMGMGGAFRTFSTGYATFFGNPAGFASSKGSLTIADIAAWAYIRPTQANLDKIQQLMDSNTSDTDKGKIINEFQAENNGLGAGAAIGLGWAGKGFGLGLTMVSENYTDALKIKAMTEMNGIIGLAFPIPLGPVTLKLGLDGRVFLRTDSDGTWNLMNIMGSGSFDPTTLPIINGYGFAADAGAVVELGPLMVGAAIRDFGLGFDVGHGTIQDVVDMNIPLAGTDPYMLDPKVYAGLGLKFAFGKLLAPSIYAEVSDVEAVVADTNAFWTNFHAGAELKLLNFIALRGGLNQGYYSIGAGIDLLFIEVDAAVFTEEVGLYAGNRPRSGIALQTAIRF